MLKMNSTRSSCFPLSLLLVVVWITLSKDAATHAVIIIDADAPSAEDSADFELQLLDNRLVDYVQLHQHCCARPPPPSPQEQHLSSKTAKKDNKNNNKTTCSISCYDIATAAIAQQPQHHDNNNSTATMLHDVLRRRSLRSKRSIGKYFPNRTHYLDVTFNAQINESTPLNIDTLELFYPPAVSISHHQPDDESLTEDEEVAVSDGRVADGCVFDCAVDALITKFRARLTNLKNPVQLYRRDDRGARDLLLHVTRDYVRLAYDTEQLLLILDNSSTTTTTNSSTPSPYKFAAFVEYKRVNVDLAWTRSTQPVNFSEIIVENLDDHVVGIHLSGLSPNTKYTLRVASYIISNNNNNNSNYIMLGSSLLAVDAETLREGAPLFAPMVTEISITDDTVSIRWDAPRSPNTPIVGYELILEEQNVPRNSTTSMLHYDRQLLAAEHKRPNTAKFVYLPASTVFTLTVIAGNDIGNSPPYKTTIMTKQALNKEAKEGEIVIMQQFDVYISQHNNAWKFRPKYIYATYNVNNTLFRLHHNFTHITGPKNFLTAVTVVKKHALVYLSDGQTVWARALYNLSENFTSVVTLADIISTPDADLSNSTLLPTILSSSGEEIMDENSTITGIELDWLNKWLYVSVGRRLYRYHLIHRLSQHLVHFNESETNTTINQIRVDPVNGYLYLTTFEPMLYQITLEKFDNSNEDLPFSAAASRALKPLGPTGAVDIDPNACYLVYGLEADLTLRSVSCSASTLNGSDSKVLRYDNPKSTIVFPYFGTRRRLCERFPQNYNEQYPCPYRYDSFQTSLVYYNQTFQWVVAGQRSVETFKHSTDPGWNYKTDTSFAWVEPYDRVRHMFVVGRNFQPSPRPEFAPEKVEALFTGDDVRVTWRAPPLYRYQSPAAFRRWFYQIQLNCSTCANNRTIMDETPEAGDGVDPLSWSLSEFRDRERRARLRTKRGINDSGANNFDEENVEAHLPRLLPGMSYNVHVRAFYEDNYGTWGDSHGRVLPSRGNAENGENSAAAAAALPNFIILQQHGVLVQLPANSPDVAKNYLARKFPRTSAVRMPMLEQNDIRQVLVFRHHLLATTSVGHLLILDLHDDAADSNNSNAAASKVQQQPVSFEQTFYDITVDAASGMLYWHDERSINCARLLDAADSRIHTAANYDDSSVPATSKKKELLFFGKVTSFILINGNGSNGIVFTDGRRLTYLRLADKVSVELSVQGSSSMKVGFAVDNLWPIITTADDNNTEKSEPSLVWAEQNANTTTFYRLPVAVLSLLSSSSSTNLSNLSALIEPIMNTSNVALMNTIRWQQQQQPMLQLVGGRLYGFKPTTTTTTTTTGASAAGVAAAGSDNSDEERELYVMDLVEEARLSKLNRRTRSLTANILSSPSSEQPQQLTTSKLFPDERVLRFYATAAPAVDSAMSFDDISKFLPLGKFKRATGIGFASSVVRAEAAQQTSSTLDRAVISSVAALLALVVVCTGLVVYHYSSNKRRQSAWKKRKIDEIAAALRSAVSSAEQQNSYYRQQGGAPGGGGANYPPAMYDAVVVPPLPANAGETQPPDPRCNFYDGKLLHIGIANLIRGSVVGQGHFGRVCRGLVNISERPQAPKIPCALKILARGTRDEDEFIMREAHSMVELHHHEHIIKLYGVCVERDTISLVFELMDGDVLRWLERRRSAGQRACNLVGKLLCFLRDVADAFVCLEQAQFVHRDLAARNCLIKRLSGRPWPVVKVGDFGLARDMLEDGCYYLSRERSMPVSSMAPESFPSGKFTSRTDVWSFGILLLEMFTLASEKPYAVELRELRNEIINKNLAPKMLSTEEHGAPAEICQLMADCCQRDASKRPTFVTILQVVQTLLHQYMTGRGQTPPSSASAFSDTASSPRAAFFDTSAQLMANVWVDEDMETDLKMMQAAEEQQQIQEAAAGGVSYADRRAAQQQQEAAPPSSSIITQQSTIASTASTRLLPPPFYAVNSDSNAGGGSGVGGGGEALSLLPNSNIINVQQPPFPALLPKGVLRLSQNPSYFAHDQQLPAAAMMTADDINSPATTVSTTTTTAAFSTHTLPVSRNRRGGAGGGNFQQRRISTAAAPTATAVPTSNTINNVRPQPRPWSPTSLAQTQALLPNVVVATASRCRRSNIMAAHSNVIDARDVENNNGPSPTSMDSVFLQHQHHLPTSRQSQELQNLDLDILNVADDEERQHHQNLSRSGSAKSSVMNYLRRIVHRIAPSSSNSTSSSNLQLDNVVCTTVAAAAAPSAATIVKHRLQQRLRRRETSASGPPCSNVLPPLVGGGTTVRRTFATAPDFPLSDENNDDDDEGVVVINKTSSISPFPTSSSRASSERRAGGGDITSSGAVTTTTNNTMYFNPTPYGRGGIVVDGDFSANFMQPTMMVPNALYPHVQDWFDAAGETAAAAGAVDDHDGGGMYTVPAAAAAAPAVLYARVPRQHLQQQQLADIARHKSRSGGYEEPVIDI